jgi:hypothetical protein
MQRWKLCAGKEHLQVIKNKTNVGVEPHHHSSATNNDTYANTFAFYYGF